MEKNLENIIQIQVENQSENIMEKQINNQSENEDKDDKKLKSKSEQRVWLEIFLKPALVAFIILMLVRTVLFDDIFIMPIEAFIGIIWTWVEVSKYIKPIKKRLLIYFLNPMIYYYIFVEIEGTVMILVNGIQFFGH